jgi:hypothetical protein
MSPDDHANTLWRESNVHMGRVISVSEEKLKVTNTNGKK